MASKRVSSGLSKYFSEIGKIGGKRSMKTMTAEERSERAKKAAAKSARVRKKKARERRKAEKLHAEGRSQDRPESDRR
jgi:hypothetical protein